VRPKCSPRPARPRRSPELKCRSDRFDIFLREQHRGFALELAQLAELAAFEIVRLKSLDPPVQLLRQEQQVKHADHAAVDESRQLGGHLAGEVRLIGRKLDHKVINRPKLVHIVVVHSCFLHKSLRTASRPVLAMRFSGFEYDGVIRMG
jgi:hypothetical protein